MPSHVFIPAIAAVVGLLLGSFLNVVIVRVPDGDSIVRPRSRCSQCGSVLRWYDNIPIVSWIMLRARCRACGDAISWRYPAVELAVALWFAISVLPLSRTLPEGVDPLLQIVVVAVATAALGWFLIGLALIDWREHILPNALTYTGIFVGLFFACLQALFLSDSQEDVVLQHPIHINSANAGRSTGNVFLTGPEHVVFSRLFAAVGAFLLLYLIRATYKLLRKRDGMGLGDAKLLAIIAAFLGAEATAVALALGIVLATGYALVLVVQKKANSVTRIPFGTFLAVAGLFAAAYGQRVAGWYLSLFR